MVLLLMRSRATLDANGRRHRVSIHPVLPRRMPWSSILAKKRVVVLWKLLFNASVQKAQNGPSTELIEATSCVKMSNTTMKAEELIC
jgi:hypothetical protein